MNFHPKVSPSFPPVLSPKVVCRAAGERKSWGWVIGRISIGPRDVCPPSVPADRQISLHLEIRGPVLFYF